MYIIIYYIKYCFWLDCNLGGGCDGGFGWFDGGRGRSQVCPRDEDPQPLFPDSPSGAGVRPAQGPLFDSLCQP